jgi:hypothetical protein
MLKITKAASDPLIKKLLLGSVKVMATQNQIHCEQIMEGSLDGQSTYMLRHIENGEYGSPWDWCLTLVQRGSIGYIYGLQGIFTISDWYEVREKLQELGIRAAHADRHGVGKVYFIS